MDGAVGSDQLLSVFVHEAFEQLEELERALLALEEHPQDPELLRKMMGLAHTFKGSAGTTGFGSLAELMHAFEGLVNRLRLGEIAPSGELFNELLDSLDVLRTALVSVTKGCSPDDRVQQAVVLLQQRFGGDDTPRAPAVETDSSGFHFREYDPIRMSVLRKQGSNIFRVTLERADGLECAQAVSDLRLLGHVIATAPREAEWESHPRMLRAVLASPTSLETLRREIQDAGLPLTDLGYLEDSPAPGTKQKVQLQDTIKVDVARVDRLMEMVGELVIVESMVLSAPELTSAVSPRMRACLGQLTRISNDLQDVAMCMRMVPVRTVFQKMERIVRDLAARSGKEIRLACQGEGTEVDRSIADRLAEPLVHLVRNAVDHGVETAAERLAAGKPAVATIGLSASHQGGSLVVEVSDDGRGLDRDAILEKARAQELLPAHGLQSDAAVFGLIFAPGFSTSSRVTDVSGRGVGLDVVRTSVEGMRGRLSVSSRPGGGTTFRLVVPITLAIITGTLVLCDGERYIVPTLSILECVPADPSRIFRHAGLTEVMSVRDEVVPLVRLGSALHGTAPAAVSGGLVVLVESLGRKVGLAVDDVQAQQQFVIKNLDIGVGDTRIVSGAAILPDGRVGMILNVDELAGLRARVHPSQVSSYGSTPALAT